jgi:hypothetical protein
MARPVCNNAVFSMIFQTALPSGVPPGHPRRRFRPFSARRQIGIFDDRFARQQFGSSLGIAGQKLGEKIGQSRVTNGALLVGTDGRSPFDDNMKGRHPDPRLWPRGHAVELVLPGRPHFEHTRLSRPVKPTRS